MKGKATWHRVLIAVSALLLLGLVHINLACSRTGYDEPLAPPFRYIIPECQSLTFSYLTQSQSIKSILKLEGEGQSTRPQGTHYRENEIVAYYRRGCCSEDSNLKDTTLFMTIEHFQSEENAHAYMERERSWLLQNHLLRFVKSESRQRLHQSGVDELYAYRIENWGSETSELDAIMKRKCKGGIVSWGIVFRIERYVGDYHINCENPPVMLDEYDSPFLWLDIDLHDTVVDAITATIIPLQQQANADMVR